MVDLTEHEETIRFLVDQMRAGHVFITINKPSQSIARQILAEAMRRRLKQRLEAGDI